MDPVFKNAAREARAALLLYGLVMAWILGYSAWRGYGRTDVAFVCGVPDWIFWAVIVPWFACVAISVWFGLRFMTNDDLGPEARDGVDD